MNNTNLDDEYDVIIDTLTLISYGDKVENKSSPYYSRQIYIDNSDKSDKSVDAERFVLVRFCKATLRNGRKCMNLQNAGNGYCHRHHKNYVNPIKPIKPIN